MSEAESFKCGRKSKATKGEKKKKQRQKRGGHKEKVCMGRGCRPPQKNKQTKRRKSRIMVNSKLLRSLKMSCQQLAKQSHSLPPRISVNLETSTQWFVISIANFLIKSCFFSFVFFWLSQISKWRNTYIQPEIDGPNSFLQNLMSLGVQQSQTFS